MILSAEIFLATMFSGEGYASQDSGLLVAASTDGVEFHNIFNSHEPLETFRDVRDPSIMFYQHMWYLVYSYGSNTAPLLFLAQSADLEHWLPLGRLRLAPDGENN
jgi:hypothetical protein